MCKKISQLLPSLETICYCDHRITDGLGVNAQSLATILDDDILRNRNAIYVLLDAFKDEGSLQKQSMELILACKFSSFAILFSVRQDFPVGFALPVALEVAPKFPSKVSYFIFFIDVHYP